jgi:hypothetical protein
MPRKRTLLMSSLIATAMLAAAPAARAAGGLSVTSDICNAPVDIATHPNVDIFNHAAMYGTDGTTQNQLWLAWGRGTWWNWFRLTANAVSPMQIACAASGQQAVYVFRTLGGTLRSVDRVSGWQEIAVPGSSSTDGAGRWATAVNDQGTTKVVLFSHKDDTSSGITMTIMDNATLTTRAWGNPVNLGVVPGGTNTSRQHFLTGYVQDLGAFPNTAPTVSIFVVGLDNRLWENRGGLTAASRSWIDHGAPPGKTLSNSPTFWPSAAGYRATVGHPPPITEGDYNKRITVPVAEQDSIWARIQTGAGAFSWQQISSAATTPRFGAPLRSGLAITPCPPGMPCFPSVRTVVRSRPVATIVMADHMSANQSAGSWTLTPGTSNNTSTQAALVRPAGSAFEMKHDGAMLHIESSSMLKHFDTKTGVVTSIGHPPP